MTNLPNFYRGMLLKDAVRLLIDWCRRNRIVFSERFTVNEGAGGTVVDLAGGGGSSTIFATGVAASIISPADNLGPPGTYGSGSMVLDVDGISGYTAGETVTVRNRFPTAWDDGTLLVVASNDRGATWQVINRYCPPAA